MNIDISNAHCGPWGYIQDHSCLRAGCIKTNATLYADGARAHQCAAVRVQMAVPSSASAQLAIAVRSNMRPTKVVRRAASGGRRRLASQHTCANGNAQSRRRRRYG